jgi:hypothetical protein
MIILYCAATPDQPGNLVSQVWARAAQPQPSYDPNYPLHDHFLQEIEKEKETNPVHPVGVKPFHHLTNQPFDYSTT